MSDMMSFDNSVGDYEQSFSDADDDSSGADYMLAEDVGSQAVEEKVSSNLSSQLRAKFSSDHAN
jgi:hypothetical protein